ncbi:LptF/LptG family permease [soil metagenome]
MRLFVPDRLDRYTLRQFAGPLIVSLVTLLLAQLLFRFLRLVDLAASAGASLTSVFVMAGNLVPHYLGLALPMAFTAAIFMSAARMCDDHELDVMLASGRSIARVAMPYFVLAAALSVFSLYLFGTLQPLTRYGYHVAAYDAAQTGWNARIEPNVFVDTGQGYIFTAVSVEPDGRHVNGVFMERRGADGSEEITTALKGEFVPGPDGSGLSLNLDNGVVLRERPRPAGDDSGLSTLRFTQGTADHDFSPDPDPYRARGDSVSELTFGELWRDMRDRKRPAVMPRGKKKEANAGTTVVSGIDALGGSSTSGSYSRAAASAEFHSRLAHALVLPLLPLLALPLGMASRGGRRAPGVVFATLALLLLNHALQFGESLGERGHVSPLIAVWTPWLLFALLSLWIFRGSLAWPGDNSVVRAVNAIDRLFEGVKLGVARRRGGAAAGTTP